MAVRTISNAGGNWTATTAWVEGVVPTAADDVVATATSGNLTINAAAACRSLNLAGYTGTLTHTAAVTLSIGDATAGAGNVALKFVAGMTYTLGSGSTCVLSFVSSSATQQTVDFAGKTVSRVTFNGAGASWLLSSHFVGGTGTILTVAQGTFDANDFNVTTGLFVSTGGSTRIIRPRSGTWTITGTGTVWNIGTFAGTFTPGTWTLIFDSALAQSVSPGGSPVTFNAVIVRGTGTFSMIGGSGQRWIGDTITFEAGRGTITFPIPSGTNPLNFNNVFSNGTAANPLTWRSAVAGTRTSPMRIVTQAIAHYTDFRDIDASGAAGANKPIDATDNCTDSGNNANVFFAHVAASPSASDTVTISDSATVSTALVRGAADSIAVSDVAQGRVAANRSASDAVAIGDQAQRVSAGGRAGADAVAVTDAAARLGGLARAAAESVAVTDAAARAAAFVRAGADAGSVSDAAERGAAALVRGGVDGVSVADAAVRGTAAARSGSDAVTVADAAAREQAGLAAGAENVAVTDAATRRLDTARAAADVVAVTDQAARTAATGAGASDSWAVHDAAGRRTALVRGGSDGWAVSDAAQRSLVGARTGSELVPVTDAASRTRAGLVMAFDAWAVTDSARIDSASWPVRRGGVVLRGTEGTRLGTVAGGGRGRIGTARAGTVGR